MPEGLAAIAEQKKKQAEAQKAASGATPPVAGLKAAAPKPTTPKPAPKATKSTSALVSDVDRILAGTSEK